MSSKPTIAFDGFSFGTLFQRRGQSFLFEPIFLSVILFLIIATAPAGADTTVNGTIGTDTTWSAAGSPYIVSGSLLVDQGAKLAIDPGVEVRLDPGVAIRVDGTLAARGTSGQWIKFTSNAQAPAPGDWAYLLFADSSSDAVFDNDGNYTEGCILEYAVIEYAGTTIQSLEAAVSIRYSYPFINHCIIKDNNTTGIYAVSLYDTTEKTLRITNNTIANNDAGYGSAGGIYLGSAGAAVIEGNFIAENSTDTGGGGINLFYATSVTVSNNVIFGNTAPHAGGIAAYRSYSIVMAGNVIAGNTADTTAGGVESSDSEIVFSGNAVVGNTAADYPALAVTSDDVYENNTLASNSARDNGDTSAIRVSGLYNYSKHPRFTANNIFGNQTAYYLREDNPHTTDSTEPYLNAEGNWWGTAEEEDLINRIYDFGENPDNNIVDYTPWEEAIMTQVPISPPTDLSVAPGENPDEILLNWTGNPETDLAGYRVYLKQETDPVFTTSTDAGAQTSLTLSGLSPGVYHVAVTAYDEAYAAENDSEDTPVDENRTAGHESWFSRIAAVTVPVFPGPPQSPMPLDGAVDVPVDTALSWSHEAGDPENPVVFDLYLGTSETPPLVAENLASTGFVPESPLSRGTRYYWQVVARDSRGAEKAGPVCQFTTIDAGKLTGRVITLLTGLSTPVSGALVTWTETGESVVTDAQGNFEIAGFTASSTGNLRTEMPNFNTADLYGITVEPGTETQTGDVVMTLVDASSLYTQEQLDQAVADANAVKDAVIATLFTREQLDQAVMTELLKWDAGGDGAIGLAEAIRALQTVSGGVARP